MTVSGASSDLRLVNDVRGEAQPRGIYVLAATELWERFSFYGMRSLLLLYLLNHVGLGQAQAAQLYGYYMGAMFLAPTLGGMLADRLLGPDRAVVLGMAAMFGGHVLMAIDHRVAFYAALTLLVLGTGALKPNIATLVGRLYPVSDGRRDQGFLIFYLAICFGAAIAPLACGYAAQRFGFHVGFSIAAIGMAVSLVVLQRGWSHVRVAAPAPTTSDSKNTESSEGRSGLKGMMIVSAFAIVYWATAEQSANALVVFSEQNVERTVMLPGAAAWEIPPSWFLALNPIAILLLGPFVAKMWAQRAARGRRTSSPRKMALGLAVLGGAFVQLALAVAASGGTIAVGWYVLFYFILSLAELFFLPNGLSLATGLMPPGRQGPLMAVWFIAGFIGNVIGGWVASLWPSLSPWSFCGALAAALFVASAWLFAVAPRIERLLSEGGTG